MRLQRSRREFLRSAAATGAGLLLSDAAWAQDGSSGQRLRFACIGVGGKGESDTADAARFGDVVALCDVDDNILAQAAKKYPNARRYNDYRRLLDEMGGGIDAVTVSTPDHNHAPIAARAMRMGKHCFCQKPLTHSLYEARRLAQIAGEMKVATQMGNQGTAESGLRRSAALIRAGALGAVREVHVWTNRPIWPQGGTRPDPAPIPPPLHWLQWLGPAPRRVYGPGYHTFAWRGWWDFGTGALGDMGCHIINLSFMALDLRDPESVVAETSGHNRDSYPKWSIVRYEFPATPARPALSLFWYDGGKRPPEALFRGEKISEGGSLLIGDRATLYAEGDYGGGRILGSGVDVGEVSFPQSPGHFEEWVRAIRGGEPAMSNFPGYAGPLTETVLLGNLAVWADGKKIEWDAPNLRAKNAPEVASIIYPQYRAGHTL